MCYYILFYFERVALCCMSPQHPKCLCTSLEHSTEVAPRSHRGGAIAGLSRLDHRANRTNHGQLTYFSGPALLGVIT